MKQPLNKPQSPQPTAAMQAVIHSGQSALLAGFLTLLTAIGQYLVSGSFDWKSLLTVLFGAFAGMLLMVWKSISSNPQLAQAALDAANLALQRIEQVAPWVQQDISKFQTGTVPTAPPARSAGGGLDIVRTGNEYQVVRTNTPNPYANMAATTGYSAGQVPFPGLNYQDLNRLPPAMQSQKDMSFLQENRPSTQQGG